jgi:hypothetical protein
VLCSSAQLIHLRENGSDGSADSEAAAQEENTTAKPYTRDKRAVASGMRD